MMNLNKVNMVSAAEEGKMALGCFLIEAEENYNKVLRNGKEIAVKSAFEMVEDVEKFIYDDDESCTVVLNGVETVFEFIQ